MKKLQAGELEIKEAKAVAAVRNRLEMDGLRTEEANAIVQVCQLYSFYKITALKFNKALPE